jgi:hypothetical protein
MIADYTTGSIKLLCEARFPFILPGSLEGWKPDVVVDEMGFLSNSSYRGIARRLAHDLVRNGDGHFCRSSFR